MVRKDYMTWQRWQTLLLCLGSGVGSTVSLPQVRLTRLQLGSPRHIPKYARNGVVRGREFFSGSGPIIQPRNRQQSIVFSLTKSPCIVMCTRQTLRRCLTWTSLKKSFLASTLEAMNTIFNNNALKLLVVEAGRRARPEEPWPPALVHVFVRALVRADAIDPATEI